MKVNWPVTIAAIILSGIAGGLIGALHLGGAGLALSFLVGVVIQGVAIVKFKAIDFD